MTSSEISELVPDAVRHGNLSMLKALIKESENLTKGQIMYMMQQQLEEMTRKDD